LYIIHIYMYTGGWPPLNCSLFSNNVLINGYFVSSFLLFFFFFLHVYMYLCSCVVCAYTSAPSSSAAIVAASYARHCHRPEDEMGLYNIRHDRAELLKKMRRSTCHFLRTRNVYYTSANQLRVLYVYYRYMYCLCVCVCVYKHHPSGESFFYFIFFSPVLYMIYVYLCARVCVLYIYEERYIRCEFV
jgi:hypothetical protein